jgi:hypothetical protein
MLFDNCLHDAACTANSEGMRGDVDSKELLEEVVLLTT